MQIYPVTPTSGSSAEAPATAGKKALGQEDFLKLLSVQMQAQDPMNPMKDTEFVAQMASFTSLEQMKSLSSSFSTFISQQKTADAQSYIGKTVTVADSHAGLVTGTVSGVSIIDGAPQLMVGDRVYDPSAVTMIHGASAPAQ